MKLIMKDKKLKEELKEEYKVIKEELKDIQNSVKAKKWLEKIVKEYYKDVEL